MVSAGAEAVRREMYGIPDEACKEKEREVTFIGGAGINAPCSPVDHFTSGIWLQLVV